MSFSVRNGGKRVGEARELNDGANDRVGSVREGPSGRRVIVDVGRVCPCATALRAWVAFHAIISSKPVWACFCMEPRMSVGSDGAAGVGFIIARFVGEGKSAFMSCYAL